MPAPSKTNLLTLDFYQNGQPFCNVLAGSAGTNSTDFYQNAAPFYAIGSNGTSISVNAIGSSGVVQLGIVTIRTNFADVDVLGVQATFILNLVNVWGDIVPVPTSPWSPVNASQTETWVIIDKAAG
jgi:hypothetical protein